MKVPRPSRPRPRTVLISTAAALVALALVLGLVGVQAVRRPFPTHDGQLALPSLSAPVTVHRDDHGIPQVYADTAGDLFRAQGFVHAQDRFWEMDFRRHVTSGRLAELFGPDQVEADTFLRTLGWRRVAEREWDLISAEARRHLTAYAEGVNAWIDATGGPAATGRKALQYRVLGLQNSGYEVAPWHPVDTLAWLKAMAWDLRGNMQHEIDRALMLDAGLDRAQVGSLYPDYPYSEHDPIVSQGRVAGGAFDPDAAPADGQPSGTGGGVHDDALTSAAGTVAAVRSAAAQVPDLLGTAGSGLGSNSWVVSGDRTATGAPILANDPHLGVSMPGIWYQMGLHCRCDYRVSGYTFSGVPGVVIGHNDRIAWGFTNLDPDVTDLYLERVDGDRYRVDGQWRDLQVREETIEVAGGDDATVRVRRTHHGPLVSDASAELARVAGSGAVAGEPGAAGDGFAVSLAWTALTPGRTIDALFRLNRADGWEEFRAAAALFDVPSQNLVYADVAGTIGYQAPGRVPVRGAGDGRWIAPGWDPAYDWQGFVPFEQLPWVRDPADGMIVTANQAVAGPQYQPLLSEDWSYGYRSHRIGELLARASASGPLTVADMERIALDNRHGFAPTLVPALLRVDPPARDLLAGWDYRQPAGGEPGTGDAASSAAAAYYNAIWRHLLVATFDEIPEDARPAGRDRWFEVVAGLLDRPDSPWWDRPGTEATETRDGILADAATAAYDELVEAQGDGPADWRWGRMHTLTLRDETFGTSGIAPVEALFNRGPVAVAGGTDLVNATSWNASVGYEVTAAPSMRMVVDLSDLDASRWVQMTGNSGHAYHAHYTDQLELWRTGGTLPWRWDRATIEAAATGTLTLHP